MLYNFISNTAEKKEEIFEFSPNFHNSSKKSKGFSSRKTKVFYKKSFKRSVKHFS